MYEARIKPKAGAGVKNQRKFRLQGAQSPRLRLHLRY